MAALTCAATVEVEHTDGSTIRLCDPPFCQAHDCTANTCHC